MDKRAISQILTSVRATFLTERATPIMNVVTFVLRTGLLAAVSLVPAYSETVQQQNNPGQAPAAATPATDDQSQGPVPSGTQSTTLPAPSQTPQGSAPLRV